MFVSDEVREWIFKNSKAVNVKEVREFLETFPDEMLIGFLGNCELFQPLHLKHFSQRKVILQTDPSDMRRTFMDNLQEYCLCIECPDSESLGE